MFLLVNFLFIRLISIYSKGCLSISSDESCITCLSSHFESKYLNNLQIATTTKFSLSENDCILKENKKLIRKIHILNSKCSECFGADSTYTSLPVAFEEESKLSIKFYKKKWFFFSKKKKKNFQNFHIKKEIFFF